MTSKSLLSTLVLLAATLGACGNYSNEDLEYMNAIPARDDMSAYVKLQEAEFELESLGYTATRHQREAGTGYFDLVTQAIAPNAETFALAGSTERAQFA